eukprot:618783-Rhodomonas_salina.1
MSGIEAKLTLHRIETETKDDPVDLDRTRVWTWMERKCGLGSNESVDLDRTRVWTWMERKCGLGWNESVDLDRLGTKLTHRCARDRAGESRR